jgi:hypothetical protein
MAGSKCTSAEGVYPEDKAMGRSPVLFVDALINLALGVLLIPFPARVVELLGMPASEQRFYPSILGAVLFGIGLALLVECYRRENGLRGLGLGGAVAINLSGGVVLAGWLVFGALDIPGYGTGLLWALVCILFAISGVELAVFGRRVEIAD